MIGIASANDELATDIVCEGSKAGIKVEFKSNPYSWVNFVTISEIGYLGSNEIASFQISKNQPFVTTPSFFNDKRTAIYKSRRHQEFHLEMAVDDDEGKKPSGPGLLILAVLGDSGKVLRNLELNCSGI